MKLLAQRVTRATAEVDGLVECRIGAGLVLMIGIRSGDTPQTLERVAAKVAKLKLWPEQLAAGDSDLQEDAKKPWHSNVVDSGFEVMVVLQQSICATFPGLEPSEKDVMEPMGAQMLFEAFLKKLRALYQDEMVVAAPIGSEVRLDTTSEGNCLFDLSQLSAAGTGVQGGKPPSTPVPGKSAAKAQMEPDISVVSKALRQLSGIPRSKQTLESSRIFKVFSMRKFRDALSDADQATADHFAEALDGAGSFFTAKQQEQITAWTGLAMVAPPREEAPGKEQAEERGEDEWVETEEQDADEGQTLEQQLAELREEVADPHGTAARKVASSKAKAAKKTKPSAVKQEPSWYEDAGNSKPATHVVARRPDWTGRPAPETPAAAAARSWAKYRQQPWQQHAEPSWNSWNNSWKGNGKGGKGKGKGKGRRSWGIVSLDESARLHGTGHLEDFDYGQLKRFSDGPDGRIELLHPKKEKDGWGGVKAEVDEEAGSGGQKRKAVGVAEPALKLPKGMPTVAPMTPAAGGQQDQFDDL